MTNSSYAVFYHIWAPAGSDIWQMVVDDQLSRIEASSLPSQAQVYCCISGPQCRSIENFVSGRRWLTTLAVTEDESDYEGLTLKALHDRCMTDPALDGVAYIHTKGIRYFGFSDPATFRAVNSWRRLLEWGTIDKWRDATTRLAQFDIVGVNYRTLPWPHFGGNFWWARPSYIRGLPPPIPALIGLADGIQDNAADRERVSYEKWIGSNSPRPYSLAGYPFYVPGRPPDFGGSLYTDDIGRFYEQATW